MDLPAFTIKHGMEKYRYAAYRQNNLFNSHSPGPVSNCQYDDSNQNLIIAWFMLILRMLENNYLCLNNK